MDSLAKPLFAAEGIGKSFFNKVVLKSASFWVREGQVTALLGRNGSGKTTLVRAALGEIRMDYGFVRFLGTDYERPALWQLARQGLRYLDQDARLPASSTLRSTIDVVSESTGASASDWIKELDLGSLLDSRIPELSRGERKRAALAVTLIPNPRCLILDEPFEGVEPRDQEMLSGCLSTLAGQGVGVLLTGHDVRIILETATNVVWCVAGTTHDLGPVSKAVEHPQFVREYLGPDRISS